MEIAHGICTIRIVGGHTGWIVVFVQFNGNSTPFVISLQTNKTKYPQ